MKHDLTGWTAHKFVGGYSTKVYHDIFDPQGVHKATISSMEPYFRGYGFDWHAADMWSYTAHELSSLIGKAT